MKGQESVYGILASYAYNVGDWNDGRAGTNYTLTCYWNNETDPKCNPQPWQIGHKRTAIKRASEKINFIESNDWWGKWADGANYVQGWDILGQALSNPDYADIGMYGATLYRHNEGAIFAFYDGHVEHLPKEKAFIDTDGNLENGDTDDATGMWYVLPP
jgi:prepilin-type processing-associated H-X9-DG protein